MALYKGEGTEIAIPLGQNRGPIDPLPGNP